MEIGRWSYFFMIETHTIFDKSPAKISRLLFFKLFALAQLNNPTELKMSSSRRLDTIMSQLSTSPCHHATSAARPVKVCVTGAAGNIAYSILFHIGTGRMLGPQQPIELRLLDM